MADNSMKTLKNFFHKELDGIYESLELANLFYLMVNSVKGWGRAEIQLNIAERLSESELLVFLKFIKRLKSHEPIQYIIGHTEFAGCKILVDKNVLIPRPETEELVYVLMEKLKGIENPVIMDLCTGSGCIAIALKKRIPGAIVYGMDISKEAIAISKINAAENETEVNFSVENVLDYFPSDYPKFDCVVSNPPYVLRSEKGLMNANIRNHEPHLALFVENDNPLLFYRRITNLWKFVVKPVGILAFEVNEKYGNEVREMLVKTDAFSRVECLKDMQEKDRMVIAIKNI